MNWNEWGTPPPELCLGCGDDLEFGDPIGTGPRHICQRRWPCHRPPKSGANDD